MKKAKIIIRLFVVFSLLFSLSACSEDKKKQDSQSNAVGNQDNSNPDEGIGTIDDPNNKIEDDFHITSPGTHDGYYHEVGNAGFYTKHDLNKWLKPHDVDPTMYDFDIGQMLYDIWCVDGGGIFENNVGFSYTNGDEWTKGLWVEVPDEDSDRVFHSATVYYDYGGGRYTTNITIYRYPKPFKENKTKYCYILDKYYRSMHTDLAPLILLAVERMEENPQSGALNDLDLGDNFYCD